jgi:hypothetical protein
MTLRQYLTKELLDAESALDSYGDTDSARGYWVGQLDALNNALDFLEGAAVYSEAVS